MNSKKQSAVIMGAGGFTGAEILRLLAIHPYFELDAAYSSTYAGKSIADIHAGLDGWTDIGFSDPESFDPASLDKNGCTVFCALGHTKSMKLIGPLLKKSENPGLKIVDLSADFRLDSADEYEKHYPAVHCEPGLLDQFVYGLPELNRSLIAEAQYTANPGCFATAAQLAVLPAAASGTKIKYCAIDGKTGSSGAGIKSRTSTHHPLRMNNFAAYKTLTHQHLPEIRMGWKLAGGSDDACISFVPHMAPMARGIFVTAHMFADSGLKPDEIRQWYESFYSDAPFVRIVDGSPEVTAVWGSNRCDISVSVADRCIAVCAAMDNLIKGASGQAVQNANIMNGFEETAGLTAPAPWPV